MTVLLNGKQEKRGRQKRRKIIFDNLFERTFKRKIKDFLESGTPVATLTKGLLLTAALGGILAVGIMAPNLFKAFGMKQAYEKRSKRVSKDGFFRLRRSCYQLQKKHWVEFVSEDAYGNHVFRITDKGKVEIQKILKEIPEGIARPDAWDHKWRLVIFDIPVTYNNARDALRYGIRSLGCYPIQQSAWVHPFSCAKEIKEMTVKLGLQDYVKVYTVEDFEHKEAFVAFRDLLKDYS